MRIDLPFGNLPGALCADPDIDPETFFSDDLTLQDIACELCSFCIHGPEGTDECFQIATELDAQMGHAWGVWGGRTARERQLLIDAEDGDSGA